MSRLEYARAVWKNYATGRYNSHTDAQQDGFFTDEGQNLRNSITDYGVNTFGWTDEKLTRQVYIHMVPLIQKSECSGADVYTLDFHACLQLAGKTLQRKMIDFWMISRPYSTGYTRNIVVDVIADGSCLFQALYYCILPFVSREEAEGMIDLHAFKMAILNIISCKRIDELATDSQLERLTDVYGVKTRENAASLMGIDLERNTSKRNEWADDAVMLMAAMAYGVQIILYRSKASTARDVERIADGHTSDTMHVEYVYDTSNKFIGEEPTYSGQNVIILLYETDRNHYCIISRYPLNPLRGVDEHGRGERGVLIPRELKLSMLGYQDENPRLVCMERCMRCGKQISDIEM